MTRNISPIFAQRESRVQSYARAFPATFARARGAELWDLDGRRYLDFLAGCGSLNYGHNDPVLKSALLEHITSDAPTHGLDLHTPTKQHFLEVMEDVLLVPRALEHVVQFTGPTGANAVEAALKLARKVTGRTNVIFFTNGYHGVSLGALAVTGNRFQRNGGGMPLSGATVMPYDGYMGESIDTLDYVEAVLDDPSSGVELPAAVIVEGVQGEGGLNAASAIWLRRLRTLCDRYGIVLIVDEIQSGCGRTGQFFSFEAADIVPDLITLAKSISGYGLPMSLLLIRPGLDQWQPAEHNGTFRGNNHAFITATAALDHYWRTPALAYGVVAKGELLATRLESWIARFPDDLMAVRGRGMMRGLRCADPVRAARVTATAFELGLIIERSGPRDEVIKCMMPLNIENPQLEEGLGILEHALLLEYATAGS